MCSVFSALALLLNSTPLAVAANPTPANSTTDCRQKVCVEVYTDPTTNQLVIKARKGSGPVAPKPVVTHPPTRPSSPKPTATGKPRPYVYRPYTYRPYTYRPYTYRPYTPRPKRKAQVAVPAPSLADQLSQLIPTHHFYYQPSPAAIVGIAVNVWSDTNPQFSTLVNLLGEAISVDLHPSFIFNFGDGSPPLTSDSPGASYPAGTITHTYSHPGDYSATLQVSWGGQWSVAGLVSPVLGGAIVQNYQQLIRVIPAPTKYFH
jgi:hypothetical protein